MKITINKSIENTYKNEIWKGFTLREIGCGIGALLTIGTISFLAYRFLHLSFSIGVYIGIPFCFPWVLLGFKKFSGMTLIPYLRVRKARREAGILMKTDNLPPDLPGRSARMQTDLSYGEERGFSYEFGKKQWKKVRREDLLYRLSHWKKVSFAQYAEGRFTSEETAGKESRRVKKTSVQKERSEAPFYRTVMPDPEKKRRRSGKIYFILGAVVLLITAAAFLYLKGYIRPGLFQKTAAQESETETAESHASVTEPVTETKTKKEPEPVPVLSSDATLKQLMVGKETMDLTKKPFTLKVRYETKTVAVTAVANDAKATVEGAGKQKLKVGKNKIIITVKAEDGSAKKYVVTIVRKKKKAPAVQAETPEANGYYNYNYYYDYNINNNVYTEPQSPAPSGPEIIVPEDNHIQIIG